MLVNCASTDSAPMVQRRCGTSSWFRFARNPIAPPPFYDFRRSRNFPVEVVSTFVFVPLLTRYRWTIFFYFPFFFFLRLREATSFLWKTPDFFSSALDELIRNELHNLYIRAKVAALLSRLLAYSTALRLTARLGCYVVLYTKPEFSFSWWIMQCLYCSKLFL